MDSGSPLPDLSSEPLATLRDLVDIDIENYRPVDDTDKTKEVLRAFAYNLPDDGCRNICLEILDCRTSEQHRTLAKHYFEAVLVPRKSFSRIRYIESNGARLTVKSRSKTPRPQTNPLFGAEDEVEAFIAQLPESAKRTARFRVDCLRRDGYRCLVTGLYEHRFFNSLSDQQKSELGEESFPDRVDASHIIPFSLSTYTANQV
jgi:hypothetical protein